MGGSPPFFCESLIFQELRIFIVTFMYVGGEEGLFSAVNCNSQSLL